MTDKEFKRLSRAQLLDVIYQLQLQVDELTKQNQALKTELRDKRLRIDNAGTLAEAALEINNCFKNAQNAADQYLNEIKAIREEAEAERRRIIEQAQAEAAALLGKPQKTKSEVDSAIEELLKEYRQNRSQNG